MNCLPSSIFEAETINFLGVALLYFLWIEVGGFECSVLVRIIVDYYVLLLFLMYIHCNA